MNKKMIFSLFAILLLLVGCDYNDKYFDGYDDTLVTDVIQYEGDFTGKYPAEGYFTDRGALQNELNSMLKKIYPYCDKGSMAKVNVLFGDITVDYEPVTADVSYELTTEDYDAMGTDAGQPGKYNNFDSSMDVDAYLKIFCSEKYASLAEGKIISITYKYYASGTTSSLVKTYKKGVNDWEEFSSFTPDKKYELTNEDYDAMGTESGTPGKYNNFDSNMDVDFYLTTFLKQKLAYAKPGTTCEVTYKYYANKITTDEKALYKYDGNAWAAYDPFAENLAVSTKIAELSFDGSTWTLLRLLGGNYVITFAAEDYQTLVNWVAENKPAFMSSQNPTTEEYYFGSSGKYGNINNKYGTWKAYYNIDGYLDGKTDEETQEIMDERLAFGISEILLPSWITEPDPGLSYIVVYKIYSGRGDGNYAMSFMYNEETGKYEKTAGPVAR